MSLKNDLLLQAANGILTARPPVWLMRQAGRILPQYRAVRERLKDFKELVETPELACEVTLQPVDELGVDAAIIFSDILVIPEAMGLPYVMIESKGPVFPATIQSAADVAALRIADKHTNLRHTISAINITKAALNNRVPLIGFAGAPLTLLTYMTEGGGSKTFSKAKKFLYTQSETAHLLLQKITQSTINYLKAQIEAGADIVQIFDSNAGILPPTYYAEFGLQYIRQICEAIGGTVPITVFAKDAHFALADIATLPCQVIGLDWTINPATARATAPHHTLQGNLDPCLLYADFATIRRETHAMLHQFGTKPYIANLGHGVYPDTPLDGVKCFVDTVKNYNFT